MKSNDSKQGGKRAGAGRKRAAEQKTTISFRVTDDVKQQIQTARQNGIDTNMILNEVIKVLVK